MNPDDRTLLPDDERPEPRVRDELDPEQGPPVADDDGAGDDAADDDGDAVSHAPAAAVVDPERTDPPEPSEPA